MKTVHKNNAKPMVIFTLIFLSMLISAIFTNTARAHTENDGISVTDITYDYGVSIPGGYYERTNENYINDGQFDNPDNFCEQYISKKALPPAYERSQFLSTDFFVNIPAALTGDAMRIDIHLSKTKCGSHPDEFQGETDMRMTLYPLGIDNFRVGFETAEQTVKGHIFTYDQFYLQSSYQCNALIVEKSNRYILSTSVQNYRDILPLSNGIYRQQFRIKLKQEGTYLCSWSDNKKVRSWLNIIEIDVRVDSEPEVSSEGDKVAAYGDDLSLHWQLHDDVCKDGNLYHRVDGISSYSQSQYVTESLTFHEIAYPLPTLNPGNYDFTMFAKDGWSSYFESSDTVNLHVLNDIPLLTHEIPTTLAAGSIGNTLNFTVSDGYMKPGASYSIYYDCNDQFQGGTLLDSGVWEDGTKITVIIDAIASHLGIHRCRLVVFDGYSGTPGFSDGGYAFADFSIATFDDESPLINAILPEQWNQCQDAVFGHATPNVEVEIADFSDVISVSARIDMNDETFQFSNMLDDRWVLNGSLNSDWDACYQTMNEDVYLFSVNATDSEGNSNIQYYGYEVDLSPPAVSFEGDEVCIDEAPEILIFVTDSTSTTAKITLEGQDFTLQKGLSSSLYYMNHMNQFWDDYQSAFNALEDGEVTICIVVEDLAGNVNVTDYKIHKDTSPCSLRCSSEIEGRAFNEAGFEYSFIDKDIVSMTVQTPYTDPVGIPRNGTIPESFWSRLTYGLHQLEFTAYDAANNANSTVFSVEKVDGIEPILVVNTPYMNGLVDETPTYNLTVIDNSTVSMWYTIGNSAEYAITSFVDTIPQSLWEQHMHPYVNITFYAQDAAGNTAWKTITVQRLDITVADTERTGIFLLVSMTPKIMGIFFAAAALIAVVLLLISNHADKRSYPDGKGIKLGIQKFASSMFLIPQTIVLLDGIIAVNWFNATVFDGYNVKQIIYLISCACLSGVLIYALLSKSYPYAAELAGKFRADNKMTGIEGHMFVRNFLQNVVDAGSAVVRQINFADMENGEYPEPEYLKSVFDQFRDFTRINEALGVNHLEAVRNPEGHKQISMPNPESADLSIFSKAGQDCSSKKGVKWVIVIGTILLLINFIVGIV